MELLLTREPLGDATPGQLSEGKDLIGYTLEDRDRGLEQNQPIAQIKRIKVHGQTAIPKGRYEIVINYSNRFRKMLPLLLNVPGFDGIRIHPGNGIGDTEGCILVGEIPDGDRIKNSRVACERLMHRIQTALTVEKVFITIQ